MIVGEIGPSSIARPSRRPASQAARRRSRSQATVPPTATTVRAPNGVGSVSRAAVSVTVSVIGVLLGGQAVAVRVELALRDGRRARPASAAAVQRCWAA